MSTIFNSRADNFFLTYKGFLAIFALVLFLTRDHKEMEFWTVTS
jgi:hypothetical protein